MLTSPSSAPARRRRSGPLWLPDDGDIDHVAVGLAVSGARVVRLTTAERDLAILRMIRGGADVAEISAHLGTSPGEVGKHLGPLGYRLGPPEAATKHRDIVPARQLAEAAA